MEEYRKRILREHKIFAIWASCKIKYMRIIGITNHHKFICKEYQHFRDMICNILGNM